MVDPHMAAVADARYLMRRLFRIVDDEARREGVDPLANQLMIQLLGAESTARTVSELAVRLDVPLTLVSRLCRQLEARGMVTRSSSPSDARVTLVRATADGNRLTRKIGRQARLRFATVTDEMPMERRRLVLAVWAGDASIDTSVPQTELLPPS